MAMSTTNFIWGSGGSVDDDDVDVELACDVEFGSGERSAAVLGDGTSMWWSVSSCRSGVGVVGAAGLQDLVAWRQRSGGGVDDADQEMTHCRCRRTPGVLAAGGEQYLIAATGCGELRNQLGCCLDRGDVVPAVTAREVGGVPRGAGVSAAVALRRDGLLRRNGG